MNEEGQTDVEPSSVQSILDVFLSDVSGDQAHQALQVLHELHREATLSGSVEHPLPRQVLTHALDLRGRGRGGGRERGRRREREGERERREGEGAEEGEREGEGGRGGSRGELQTIRFHLKNNSNCLASHKKYKPSKRNGHARDHILSTTPSHFYSPPLDPNPNVYSRLGTQASFYFPKYSDFACDL